MLQRHELESLKLGQKVRNSVQDAVEGLGGRVTVGDVAARAGVKINEAEEALNALAADAGGTLEVSNVSSCTAVTAAWCCVCLLPAECWGLFSTDPVCCSCLGCHNNERCMVAGRGACSDHLCTFPHCRHSTLWCGFRIRQLTHALHVYL